MKVTVIDKDGNKRQKETISFTGAKQFLSSQWYELEMQEPSTIYALIQHDDGRDEFLIRVGKTSTRYWDFEKIEDKPEIYKSFK